MFKKIIFISALIYNAAFAAVLPVEHSLPALGNSIDYTLLPQEPQVFTNVFYWVIKANCTIYSDIEDNNILIKFLKKTGSVNNQHLNAGDELNITLHNEEVISIVSNPGSKVELVNQGNTTIKATCVAL